MQIFEFHFNPRKEDQILDSFIYEPENPEEKKLGSLYITGELKNSLPKNKKLIENIALTIKTNFFKSPSKSPLEALRRSLKEANKFLENEAKKDNIDWLGNLNIAVMSIKNFNLNFTKTGNVKILLVRGEKVIDIGKEIDKKNQEIPLSKTFSNIVSGQLYPKDRLLILANDIFRLFLKENILSEIISISGKEKQERKLDKELKKIFKKKKSVLDNISGFFLLLIAKRAQKPKESAHTSPLLYPTLKTPFIFSGITKAIALITKNINSLFRKSSKNKETKLKKLPKLLRLFSNFKPNKPIVSLIKPKKSFELEPSLKTIKDAVSTSFNFSFRKKMVIIIIFIAVLITGFYLFHSQKEKKAQEIQIVLDESKELITQAKEAIEKKELDKANLLYQKAWKKLSPLFERENIPLQKQIKETRLFLQNELFSINKVESVSPEFLFELKDNNYRPQKISVLGEKIYFIEPEKDKIYVFDIKEKKGCFLNLSGKIKLATNLQGKIAVFSEPDKLLIAEGNQIISEKKLIFPSSLINLTDLSSFGSNLYFLDSNQKEIIKFLIKNKNIDHTKGIFWFKNEAKKPSDLKSMAIDSSIWILDSQNNIWQFFKGDFKKEINLNIFPFPKEFSKITTQPQYKYLYLLEPSNSRIVIVDKEGKLIRQLVNNELKELKDFALDRLEKNIYLLDGIRVYRIKL